jgi:hypothetical protein
MNDIGQMISRLQHQRTAIDRAITALREIEGSSTTKGSLSARTATKAVHGQNSASLKVSAVAAQEPKKGRLTAEGRKKLSLAAKKRWALAKKKGVNPITGAPLSKTK